MPIAAAERARAAAAYVRGGRQGRWGRRGGVKREGYWDGRQLKSPKMASSSLVIRFYLSDSYLSSACILGENASLFPCSNLVRDGERLVPFPRATGISLFKMGGANEHAEGEGAEWEIPA